MQAWRRRAAATATMEERMTQLPKTGSFISVLWPVDNTWRAARVDGAAG